MSHVPPGGRSDRSARDDDDIGALFGAQADRVTLPPELDSIVRAAAREAAGAAPAADAAEPFPAAARRRAPPRRLAAAAVALLALGLVPLLRQAPPSGVPPSDAPSPEASSSEVFSELSSSDAPARRRAAADTATRAAPAAEALLAPAPASRSESVVAPRAVVAEDRAAADEPVDAADPADAERRADTVDGDGDETAGPEPLAKSSPARTAAPVRDPPSTIRETEADTPSGARTPSLADDGRAAGEPVDDPFDGHRSTPRAWLGRLRERLRADGPTAELLTEYRRFRARHPDVDPGFDPAAVRRDEAADGR